MLAAGRWGGCSETFYTSLQSHKGTAYPESRLLVLDPLPSLGTGDCKENYSTRKSPC